MGLKSLEELVLTRDLPVLVRGLAQESQGRIEILEADPQSAAATLLGLQVSTRTPLGSVAYHCGGIMVDKGWLRILGCGHPRLLWGLAEWNGLRPKQQNQSGRKILGHDAVGGFFALESSRKVSYFSPDSLTWQDTELSHKEWFLWALSDELADFYENFRWPGWQKAIAEIEGSQAFVFDPPLSATGPALKRRQREARLLTEIWTQYQKKP